MDIESIRNKFVASANLKLASAESLSPLIAQVAEVMVTSLKNGGKICWMGNGGSAADAQHMAAELVSRFYKERRALPSLSFHENSSSVTAIANDYSYEMIFVRQVEAFVKPGDVVIGLTTSGKSKNVILALKRAKEMGALTVALTGGDASALREYAQFCLPVPSKDTPRIQECHTCIGHILCELTENAFI